MLYPNYPNPFNPDTKINFDISLTTNVKILIYDISGRVVANILNQRMNPGKYGFTFSGKELSSGIYLLRLETEYYSAISRLVLMK
jgi:5-formaminoimidazole-4-carboxamide-1-beta-D-ribofuranosyl 5'-monophosphate synthetase